LNTVPFGLGNWKVTENHEKNFVLDFDYKWLSDFEIVLFAKAAGVSPNVMVEDLQVDVKVRISLEFLSDALPVVHVLKVQLLERPACLDVSVKPLASAGIDIMEIPGLSQFIKSLIVSNVEKMLVPPNAIVVDLVKAMEQQKEQKKADEASGVQKPKQSLAERLAKVQNAGSSQVTSVASGGMNVVTGLGKSVTGLGNSVVKFVPGFGKTKSEPIVEETMPVNLPVS
jgi:Ca2+-dependent lipid-binding protein